jgi:hypothetical protein
MRSFGLIGVVVAALVALAAGVIGYNLGLGANVAASGTTVTYPYWGFGFGFHPLFGLLFGILFFILIFALIRRAVWGSHGHAYGPGWGRRGWYGPDGQGREEMLERWHRQAHGDVAGDRPVDAAEPTRPGDPMAKS